MPATDDHRVWLGCYFMSVFMPTDGTLSWWSFRVPYAAKVLRRGTALDGIRPMDTEVMSNGSSQVTWISFVRSSIAWNQFCLSFPATEPPRRKISYARAEIMSCVNAGGVSLPGVASEAIGRVCVPGSFNGGDDRTGDAIVAFLSTDA
jgi:hypothetical protein